MVNLTVNSSSQHSATGAAAAAGKITMGMTNEALDVK